MQYTHKSYNKNKYLFFLECLGEVFQVKCFLHKYVLLVLAHVTVSPQHELLPDFLVAHPQQMSQSNVVMKDVSLTLNTDSH